jgi:hypothetical protein
MSNLIWYGITGFLGVTLLLSAILGAQRTHVKVIDAHKAFERSVDSLSPISDLASFMAEDNGKTRS